MRTLDCSEKLLTFVNRSNKSCDELKLRNENRLNWVTVTVFLLT